MSNGVCALIGVCLLALVGCDKSASEQIEQSAGDAAVAVSAQALGGGGCTAQSFGGHDYLFCTSDKSWDSARADCVVAGMELARISSAPENDFVRSGVSLLGNAWIGATDSAAEGTWIWSVDGAPFWNGQWYGSAVVGAYANWAQLLLQPDDLFGQDCGRLNQLDGRWDDQGCGEQRDYVCETNDATPPPPPPPAGTDTACWSAPGLQANAVWPMRGLCPLRRGAGKFIGSQVNTVNWVYPTGGDIRTGVAVAADGAVYFGSDDDYLYALNPNGTLRWRYKTLGSGDVRSSPLLSSDGAVLFGSDDNYFYSVNATTGVLRWRFNTGYDVNSSPAVGADGTLYVGSDSNRLYALNPGGTQLWSYLTGGDIDSSAAVMPDGTLVFGSDDDFVYALKPDLGLTDAQRLKWKTNVGSDVNAIPAIGPAPDNFIYVRSQGGKIKKLNPISGAILATFNGPTDLDTDSSPAIGLDGDVYVGLEHKVYALRPDLTTKWVFETGNDVKSSPAIGADGTVYIGSDNERVYALRPADGSSIWSLEASGFLSSFRGSPAIAKSGAIYLGNDDNKLYSIGSFACSAARPCGNGMGPCTADGGCASGLVCGYGVAERFGLPAEFGVCWDTGDCATFAPADCGGFRTRCGECCVPNCNTAGGPDDCGRTCQACVPGADTDRDSILDCDEYGDGTDWTNAVVFNGVLASQGPSCNAAPSCAAIDTESEIAACFAPVQTQVLASGWDFSTADQNVCDAGFGFEPEWSSCGDDFAVDYTTVMKIEQGGRHCFLLGGSTTDQCASLFVTGLTGSPGTTLQATTGTTTCRDLEAGTYDLHWFYANAGAAPNAHSMLHCFGGAADCVPTDPLETKDLLPPGQVPACDLRPAVCTERCPCSTGQVGDPNQRNGLCRPNLEIKIGVGDRFGLAVDTPVCWDPGCDDTRSQTFECGAIDDRCGLCPACPVTPTCTSKSCGSDGCFGTCGEACTAGQAGCESDADCASGLVCLQGAGPRFGLPAGLNVCAPGGCRSLSASLDPCRNPQNQGLSTECGICPPISPACAGKTCGPDGAGGTCRPTANGMVCASGIGVPVLSRPEPVPPVPDVQTAEVGALPGQFAVSPAGDATYSLPLRLPPGRGGLTPALSLSYSSTRGNGFIGMGWALDGMQAITRCGRTIAQDDRIAPVHLDDRDAFCLNGERMVEVAQSEANGQIVTEYALENNDFSSILAFEAPTGLGFSGPERYEVTRPDGRISTFGGSSDSRILGPGISQQLGLVVQTWALWRITDRFGNYAEIGYEKPQREGAFDPNDPYAGLSDALLRREYYPSTIQYSLHASDPVPQAVVAFTYDDTRPDPMNAWRAGVNIQVNRRLSMIGIFTGDQWRQYVLSYDSGNNSEPSLSRLASVKECVSQGVFVEAPTTCLPATTFDYERAGRLRSPLSAGPATDQTIQATLDFDGDGRDDLLVLDTSGAAPIDKLLLSRVIADGGTVSFEASNLASGAPHAAEAGGEAPLVAGGQGDFHVLDWDNDGRDDILDLRSKYVYRSFSDNGGNHFERISLSSTLSYGDGAPEWSTPHENFLLDLDGDGRQDLLRCRGNGSANGGVVGGASWQYALRSDTGFRDWSAPLQALKTNGKVLKSCPAYIPDGDLGRIRYDQVTDIDGDGTQELMFVVDDQVGKAGVWLGFKTLRQVQGAVPIFTVPRRDHNWLVLKIDLPTASDAQAKARVVDTGVSSGAKLIDSNGDGLQDFYQLDACVSSQFEDEICREYGPMTLRSWTNSGTLLSQNRGFTRNADLLPTLGLRQSWLQYAARVARVIDHDGDSRQDVLLPTVDDGWVVLRSTGVGFELQDLAFPLGWDYQPQIARPDDQLYDRADRESPTALDLNGDGLPDLLRRHVLVEGTGGLYYDEQSEWQVMLRSGPSFPRMTGVTNGLRKRLQIEYALFTDAAASFYTGRGYADSCTYPQRCAAIRRSAVRKHTEGSVDGNGQFAPKLRYRYNYTDGRFDLWGRGFLGFSRTNTTIEPEVNPISTTRTIYSTFDNVTRDSRTNLYYKAFAADSVTDVRSAGDVISLSQNIVEYEPLGNFASSAVANGTLHRLRRQTVKSTYEARGANASIVTLSTITTRVVDFDQYGNPKYIKEGIPQGGIGGPDQFRLDVPEGLRTVSYDYVYESSGNSSFEAAGLRHLPATRIDNFIQTGSATPWGSEIAQGRITDYAYFDNGSLRNVTAEPTLDPDGLRNTLYKRTTFERDEFGNATKRTESRLPDTSTDRVTEIIYATGPFVPGARNVAGHYPIEVVNAKDQRTAVDYDFRFGAVTRVTDSNGSTSRTFFDGFGRVVYSIAPNDSLTSIQYAARDANAPLVVATTVQGGLDEVVDYDPFGRLIHSVTKGVRGADLVSDTAYDDLDRVWKVTRPHKEGEVTTERAQTTFIYDALGRVLSESWIEASATVPDSTVLSETCYEGLRECTRNPRGFTSCLEYDTLGRVIRSWDPPLPSSAPETVPSSDLPSCATVLSQLNLRLTPGGYPYYGMTAPTLYAYGEFLEKVVDPAGNRTRMVVDRYGRRLSIDDPDSGESQTRWNAYGEIERTDDASGQASEFYYDKLGRLELRKDLDVNGSAVDDETHWYFDGEDPANPNLEPGEYVGALTLSESPQGLRKHYRYDNIGQLAEVAQSVSGSPDAPLAIGYEDYQFGRPQVVRYPTAGLNGDFAVRNTYDSLGNLVAVARDGSTAAPLWELKEANFYDQLKKEQLGDGSTGLYAHDNLGQVKDMVDLSASGSLLRWLTLAHDMNGNIVSRNEAIANPLPQTIFQTETLQYDQLDRLTTSTVSGVVDSIAYDSLGAVGAQLGLGNPTSRTGVGAYTYQAPGTALNPIKPHAVSQAGGTAYSYDETGQMILRENSASGLSEHFSWNRSGKIAQMWRNAASPDQGDDLVTLSYDADGQRINKQTALQSTSYFEGLYEKREHTSGTTDHVYYVGNGARVVAQLTVSSDATSTSSEMLYMHTDHLGTAEVLTRQDGTVAERRSYRAFGTRRDPDDWTIGAGGGASSVRLSFTGHEADDEYGLVHMIGRHYDPALGRFLSADPVVQAPFFSQSFNRYSYVFNNPLGLVDPSGYEGEELAAGGPVEVPCSGNEDMCFGFPLDDSQRARAAVLDALQASLSASNDTAFAGPQDAGTFGDPGFATLDTTGVPGEPLIDLEKLSPQSAGESVVATGGLLAASTVPFVGEAMDLAVVMDDSKSTGDRALATVSLALSVASATLLPNVGAVLIRGERAATNFNPARSEHIFREALGHVNPASAGSQARFARLFEQVASNPANLRADAVEAQLISQDAVSAGAQAFTAAAKSGDQIWVVVRNGEILNAGVNLAGALR